MKDTILDVCKRLQIERGYKNSIILIDIGLVVVAILIVMTGQVYLVLHVIFVLLSFGALFWSIRAFTVRSIFWVGVMIVKILLAGRQEVPVTECLIEICLLSIILLMVYFNASFRAAVQRDLEYDQRELKQALEERQLIQEALLHQAFYDNLTGLPNRALFFDRLQQTFLESGRNDQSFSLLFIDLDDFKSVNDRFGHDMGDQLLMEVANRMLSVARNVDTVARLGGDEFTVLIKNSLSVDLAIGMAKRILDRISEPYQVGDVELNISASIGVSMSSSKSDQPVSLLRNADHAMYHAKSGGKSNIKVYTNRM